jgi:hypothetical protein
VAKKLSRKSKYFVITLIYYLVQGIMLFTLVQSFPIICFKHGLTKHSILHCLTFKRRVKSHLPFARIIRRFNVYGSVHLKYIPIYVCIQQDTTLHSLFISGNCSTCFGWYLHPSSGAHTTVFTASGICHTVTVFATIVEELEPV